MDLSPYKRPLSLTMAIVAGSVLVLAFAGRSGALVPELIPFLRWPMGLLLLGLQVGFCFAFDARPGLAWMATVAPLACGLFFLGTFFRTYQTGMAMTGADRAISGAAVVSALTLGVLGSRGRL